MNYLLCVEVEGVKHVLGALDLAAPGWVYTQCTLAVPMRCRLEQRPVPRSGRGYCPACIAVLKERALAVLEGEGTP